MTKPFAEQKPLAIGGSLSFFERYLTVWVALCIVAGILLGRWFPQVAVTLDALSIYQVSIPIAICLFFMMYPIWSRLILARRLMP